MNKYLPSIAWRGHWDPALPERCYVENKYEVTGVFGIKPELLCIVRGESGFYPIRTTIGVDAANALYGVTPAQREAMLAGSMFGWDCPAAQVASYNLDGTFRK